jgi:hypothetical protein
MIVEGSLRTTARRGSCGAPTPTRALLGDQPPPRGWCAWPSWETSRRWPSWPTSSRCWRRHRRRQTPLADAIGQAGAAGIGWGATLAHAEAKALARAGDPGAAEALTCARDAAMAADGAPTS